VSSPTDSSEAIIKLGSPPTPITDADIAVATLKSTLLSLESQISPLEAHITALEQDARSAISAKRTDVARSILRRKNLAMTTLERRRDDVHKLHGMLDSIDRARDQVAMVRAMEASAKVLRELNAEVGGVEHVADVVEQLGEQMANVDEVTNVLSEPNAGTIDETEVEDEFEQLVSEEKAKNTKAREEEEARKTRDRMIELEEWERRKKEEQEKALLSKKEDEAHVEQEVEKRTEEMAEMHLA
jgi:charged multivesicular body protein 7